MKKILFKMMMLSCMVLTAFTSMAQGSFAYQAVIRDSKGQLVCDKTVGMRFTLSYDSKDYYQETQSTKTNAYGNVSVMVGSGTVASGSFMSVPWNTMKIMMKVEVSVDNSDYINLGAIQIQPAPYALYAASFNPELQAPANASDDEPLFSVKNSKGDIVFAVYQNGAIVYFDEDDSKAVKSGFVVSNRKATKDGESEDLFSVGANGTQVFIDEDDSKAVKSGFAVSNRKATKDGEVEDLFTVGIDGTQVFVGEDESKAVKSGFAVSNRKATKDGEVEDLFTVGTEGTQVFVDEDDSKAVKSGFAVSGRRATKDSDNNDLFSINGGDVNIAASSFNVSDKESDKVVFAVNNSKVNVNADMLMTGGIGNVAEDVKFDKTYSWTIDPQKNDEGGYSMNWPLCDGIPVGTDTIRDFENLVLYGLGDDGELIEAIYSYYNDVPAYRLCFDANGKLMQRERSDGYVIELYVDENTRLDIRLKNISTATKFCLVGEQRSGDDLIKFRVICSFKGYGNSNSDSDSKFENPYANYKYGTCKVTYKFGNDTSFVYYNMGSYEYFDMGSNVYVVLVDNGDDFKTAYICEKSGTGYKVVEDEDQYEFYSGYPCYSWDNYIKYAELEEDFVSCTIKNGEGTDYRTYELKDASGTLYYVNVEYGYVTKFSIENNVILDYVSGNETTSYGNEYPGLDSELLKQLKIGDSVDTFAITD